MSVAFITVFLFGEAGINPPDYAAPDLVIRVECFKFIQGFAGGFEITMAHADKPKCFQCVEKQAGGTRERLAVIHIGQ